MIHTTELKQENVSSTYDDGIVQCTRPNTHSISVSKERCLWFPKRAVFLFRCQTFPKIVPGSVRLYLKAIMLSKTRGGGLRWAFQVWKVDSISININSRTEKGHKKLIDPSGLETLFIVLWFPSLKQQLRHWNSAVTIKLQGNLSYAGGLKTPC